MKTTVLECHPEPKEADVQRAAYFLWLELGRPVGRDVETWLEAKERLRHRPVHAAQTARRRIAAPPRAMRPGLSISNPQT